MNTSRGEARIINVLQNADLDFRREYSFKDLRSLKHRPMKFDFAVTKDGEVNYLIEFDGEQHFKFDKHFSKSDRDFRYRQESDLRKNEYCLANKIPLYRIPFFDYEKINTIDDVRQDKYLVKTKWHNHNIKHNL